jgi:YcaO-like protein with predicted kinase domain
MDETEQPFRRLGYADGMGCHPTREIAILRALTEAAQSRAALIAGSRDDMLREAYLQIRSPDRLDQHRRDLQRPGPLRAFAESATMVTDSFDADVAWHLQRLRSVGIERAILVDLTKPELGIPVAKVVVPGLEGLAVANQWVPGRRARMQMQGAE